MIHVDVTQLRLPSGWEAEAAGALAEVRAAAPERRAALIERHREIWRRLADELARISHRKCWYCESRQERSDMSVDHFRPKSRVVESPDHNGYWWLAFEWRNYRYSCTYCNSRRRNKSDGTVGGKHDHFPLLEEAFRVLDENGDLTRESPALLDPVAAADTTVMWFREDGYADSRFAANRQPAQHARATISIDLYHLNHEHLVEARLALFARVRELIQSGKVYFDEWQAGNVAAQHGHNTVVQELRRLVRGESEHSAAARDMIRGLRDDRHAWIEAI